ncbi:MAG: hypothetical protein MI919_20935 [Holophagales bacterium]|nr:hypothetical protein [Holophagales bacterium]
MKRAVDLESWAEPRRAAVLRRWREAAERGVAPTREAWWDDLRQLGPIESETAAQLVEGGRRWPWIPPFELDQIHELVARASSPEVGQRLRRAAEAELEPAHDPEGGATELPDPAGASEATLDAPEPIPGSALPTPTIRGSETAGSTAEGEQRSDPAARQLAYASSSTDHLRVPRRGLLVAGGMAISLAGLLAGLIRFGNFGGAPPVAVPSRSLPAQGPSASAPSAAEHGELCAALIELCETLAASRDPGLREVHGRWVAPLLTLDAEEIRRRPEMAEAVIALALRRSRRSSVGLVFEQPLLSAASCGWIGGEPGPDCDPEPPVEAVRALTAWLSSAETSAGTPQETQP